MLEFFLNIISNDEADIVLLSFPPINFETMHLALVSLLTARSSLNIYRASHKITRGTYRPQA